MVVLYLSILLTDFRDAFTLNSLNMGKVQVHGVPLAGGDALRQRDYSVLVISIGGSEVNGYFKANGSPTCNPMFYITKDHARLPKLTATCETRTNDLNSADGADVSRGK